MTEELEHAIRKLLQVPDGWPTYAAVRALHYRVQEMEREMDNHERTNPLSDNLRLKWGTLKDWSAVKDPVTRRMIQDYLKLGASISAMAQHDTPEQKQLLCNIIDRIDGDIINDWSGERYTKEQAKQYVMEYK